MENKITDGKSKEELSLLAQNTIKHLDGISNKQAEIPIMGIPKDLSVIELTEEVKNLTSIGIEYINCYYSTLEYIRAIKEKKIKF